ncbi:MAG: DinB family protein [Chloroflexi bacterium]|nr:DinB family protein [Chloroflexota bacterium]
MQASFLAKSFAYTADVLRAQVSELSHDESLRQLVAGGHSINWLTGHIVSSRSTPLRRVGAEPVWSEAARKRYRNGSPPIGAEGPGVLPLPELIRLFERSQERLNAGLLRLSVADLARLSGYGKNTVAESLFYFHFHEAYLVGQLTMVAEALGKSAKYINS